MKKRSIFFRNFEKKKFILPLFVCFIIALLLNTRNNKITKTVRSASIELESKFDIFLQDFYTKLGIFKYFWNSDFNKNLLKLHRENIGLRYEIENLKSIRRENNELRSLLRLKKQLNTELIIAKIISVFSNDYARSCIINVGSSDEVEVDDIVRNEYGLIGRVCEVHSKWSCVLAITDTNSKIPVKIRKKTTQDGQTQFLSDGEDAIANQKASEVVINAILNGDNSHYLGISMKNEDTKIREGYIAETAYFENPACNGVPVGIVIKKHGECVVDPFATFSKTQTVCILKNR